MDQREDERELEKKSQTMKGWLCSHASNQPIVVSQTSTFVLRQYQDDKPT